MVEFKLNISSALDREVSGSQSIKLHYFCSFKETHGTFSQCYKNENICSIEKISEDFQLTRESTDHHNSELETGRVKGTLCWEGGRAGQLMLVLELLTHRVSLSQGNTRLSGLGLVTPAEARACPCNFCLLWSLQMSKFILVTNCRGKGRGVSRCTHHSILKLTAI